MSTSDLIVRGAREHNLKNVDLRIPRESLTVVTGLSGSGKSSLAFDTIYAEGQRRYVESLSAYARQFLGVMEKPDVDQIEGLSPAIAIEQRTAGGNPRSTVGTVTEIYDYLRLLWARAGDPHCPSCGRPVRRQTVSQIVDQVLDWPEGSSIEVLAPLVRGRKGEFRDVFEEALSEGFVRARVDGELVELSDPPSLDRNRNHDIAVVVDRLTLRRDDRERLADSVETALRMAGGTAEVDRHDGTADADPDGTVDRVERQLFSERYACPDCGLSLPELEPRQFSFNSPYGACPACDGLGVRDEPDPDAMIGGDPISILEGVVLPWGPPSGALREEILPAVAEKHGFGLNDPWGALSSEQRAAVLDGDETLGWEGAVERLRRRHREADSDAARERLSGYMRTRTCSECGYVARGFEPVQCGVCEAPADAFDKLDKATLEGLAPLEEATEEETFDNVKLKWTDGARELLRTAPNGYQRRRARAQIEKNARVRGLTTITREHVLDVAGDVLDDTQALEAKGPLKPEEGDGDRSAESKPAGELIRDGDFMWTPEAKARLQRVPEGFMRDRTKERIEACADERDATLITLDIAEAGITEGRKMMEEAIRKQREEGE